jgi:hypothetical protein
MENIHPLLGKEAWETIALPQIADHMVFIGNPCLEIYKVVKIPEFRLIRAVV